MRVQKELDETKIVLHKTMESLLARGEKLDDLVAKSDELSSASKTFYKTAKKTNSCCVSIGGGDHACVRVGLIFLFGFFLGILRLGACGMRKCKRVSRGVERWDLFGVEKIWSAVLLIQEKFTYLNIDVIALLFLKLPLPNPKLLPCNIRFFSSVGSRRWLVYHIIYHFIIVISDTQPTCFVNSVSCFHSFFVPSPGILLASFSNALSHPLCSSFATPPNS